jgi:peroxiredoxin family protein
MYEPLNLVLFSGTDDRLQAAAVLTAGAAAVGKPVNIFLQYWALDAFSRAKIERDHGLAPEAGPEGRAAVDALAAAGHVAGDPPPGEGARRRGHRGVLALDGSPALRAR